MWEYRPDLQRTAAAYEMEIFLDAKQRSFYDNLGHVHLAGKDMEDQWERLYQARGGKCESCGLPRRRDEVDADHVGRTPKTRCDCLNQTLNDNVTVCTGIRLLCTMSPRKRGYKPGGCHERKHGRVPRFGEHNAH